MTQETGVFTRILHKTLDDSEITQTIVVLEDDASSFRLVQTYELKRFRVRSGSKAPAASATYCLNSVYETRELATEQTRRLIAKYQDEGWQVCREEEIAWNRARPPEAHEMYVVQFRDETLGCQLIRATSCRIEGEHLVFFTEDGKLAALFLMEVVKTWSRIDLKIA